jgi:hypothetical protein
MGLLMRKRGFLISTTQSHGCQKYKGGPDGRRIDSKFELKTRPQHQFAALIFPAMPS